MRSTLLLLTILVVACTTSVKEAPEKSASPLTRTVATVTHTLSLMAQPTLGTPRSVATSTPIPMVTEHLVPTTTAQATPTQRTQTALETSTPSPTLTEAAQETEPRLYLPVAELSRDNYLMAVSWESGGQALSYAVQGTPAANNMPHFEPKEWDWWRFDVDTNQSLPLSAPRSDVADETRAALGACIDQTGVSRDEGCTGSTLLWESPYSNLMIYEPIDRGEAAWLARKDGTDAMRLEDVNLPQSVSWSVDGRWAVVSCYAYRAPGMEVHYLVDLQTGSVEPLDELADEMLTFVNYLRPRFSPDSRFLVYAATDNVDYEVEAGYGLFLLDMQTLDTRQLTDLFGLFQWEENSWGLYVLDNAITFEFAPDILAPRHAGLYHIDISENVSHEEILFDDIAYYPTDSRSSWHWAYSPEVQGISLVGLQPRNELGILLLRP